MILLYVLVFFVGASISSFFQVIIYRRKRNESYIRGRSYCNYCHTSLKPYALIPIINYFILSGYTSCCKRKLSLYPPIAEALGGFIAFYVFYSQGFTLGSFLYLCFLFSLYFLSLQDIDDYSVYYIDLLPALIFALFLAFYKNGGLYIFPILYASLVFSLLFFLAKGGFGGGDLILCIIVSLLYTRILDVFYCFLLAFVFAAIYGLYLIINRDTSEKRYIPLIPFLSLGYFIHFFFINCYNM